MDTEVHGDRVATRSGTRGVGGRARGEALPTYASKHSRKDFTQPPLFAVLVPQKFFKTDYRGIAALLREWSDLRRASKLTEVPDHSTLCYTQLKPSQKGLSIGCCPRASLGLAVSA